MQDVLQNGKSLRWSAMFCDTLDRFIVHCAIYKKHAYTELLFIHGLCSILGVVLCKIKSLFVKLNRSMACCALRWRVVL